MLSIVEPHEIAVERKLSRLRKLHGITKRIRLKTEASDILIQKYDTEFKEMLKHVLVLAEFRKAE